MRIVGEFSVPFKEILEEEKVRMEAELRSANKILEKHHKTAKSQGYRGGRRAFFASLCKHPKSHNLPEEDLRAVISCKDMEWDFLCAYSKMILKIARSKSRALDNSISEEDIYAVAVEGFLKAFCCFTQEGVRFSTYLTACVSRHIYSHLKSSQKISVPLEVVRLRSKVARLMSEGLTLDSAMDAAEVPEKVRSKLVFSMSKVENMGHGANMVTAKTQSPNELCMENISGMEGEMEGLELLVFKEFVLLGDAMNLSDVAKRTVNPSTGKPYTRMSMSIAWRRVRDKISKRYSKVA